MKSIFIQVVIFNNKCKSHELYSKIIATLISLPDWCRLKNIPELKESFDVCNVISLTKCYANPVRYSSIILGNRGLDNYSDIINIEPYYKHLKGDNGIHRIKDIVTILAKCLTPDTVNVSWDLLADVANRHSSNISWLNVNGPRPIGAIGYMSFSNLRINSVDNVDKFIHQLESVGSKIDRLDSGFVFMNTSSLVDLNIFDSNYMKIANACAGFLRMRA
jgi:hypothetical protein